MKLSKKLKSIWQIISRDDSKCPEQGIAVGGVPYDYPGMPNEGYLVDFRADRFGAPLGQQTGYAVPAQADQASSFSENKVARVVVKPKDVLHELGRAPTNWSLEGLNGKIEILKKKRELITQHFAAEEVDGLLKCLENRRRYDDASSLGPTFREFFSRFDCTNQQKIDELLVKYELTMREADIFIPEFPDDAVTVMSDFTKFVQELCDKKPRYYVIANSDQFRDAYGKRDPILLAQSPFGFYYYILGAWDKEMLYLPEL